MLERVHGVTIILTQRGLRNEIQIAVGVGAGCDRSSGWLFYVLDAYLDAYLDACLNACLHIHPSPDIFVSGRGRFGFSHYRSHARSDTCLGRVSFTAG